MDLEKTEELTVSKVKRTLSVILEYANSCINGFRRKSGQAEGMEAVLYWNGTILLCRRT